MRRAAESNFSSALRRFLLVRVSPWISAHTTRGCSFLEAGHFYFDWCPGPNPRVGNDALILLAEPVPGGRSELRT